MQIFTQLESLNLILKKLPPIEGGAIFKNKSGKFLFAVYVSRKKKYPASVWILQSREELDLQCYAATIEQQAPNFEEYREADWFRQGILIEEREVGTIPDRTFNYLYGKGIQLFKRKTVIYATNEEAFEFQEGSVVQGEKREYVERLMKILLTGNTFREVTKRIRSSSATDIPVFTYNQRTGECLFADAWEQVGDINGIPEWESYVSRKPESLFVSEFNTRVLLRDVKKLPKAVTEVKIGLLPLYFHMQLDPMFPLCYQQAGDGHVHVLSFDLTEIPKAYAFVQYQLLKKCMDSGYCPKKIVTRGPYATLLKNILHPILNKLDIIVEEVEQLPMLDRLDDIAKENAKADYNSKRKTLDLVKEAASLTPSNEIDAFIDELRRRQFDPEFLKAYIKQKKGK